ncbi:zinc-binding dehydrogenase [Allokutzneria sp. A3M-2-11 16]|uniref:zinc-binding dehydrogenase n=1 Tax=Allokutzneria sp. A3M-2-11 16 TaxID=2962043 RepID=UPI0020B73B69|nr:zinc-binding dehydrogenase [Allokutzneria sp. A3M-2-11 16]MCP3805340.1 zinc-binding dehydrogenase [Allokutzneria sp. A3M-2-11 16]
MRVVRAVGFGGPEVLEVAEAPEPVPVAGEVLVEVSAADVIFLDTQLRTGWASEAFGIEPPYVPGFGVAGRIAQVGEGVEEAWVGAEVAARVPGAYAEQVVVKVGDLVKVPEGLDKKAAAALLHDGVTALGVFDNAQVKPGERVLVTAAAGGLGILLVQLARAAGATVIGAARGKKKLDLAREHGAAEAVDYTEPGWAEQVGSADVVFDGAGGEIGRAALKITKRWFSAHGAASGGFAEGDAPGVTVRGIEQAQFTPEQAVRLAERALEDAVAGRMNPVIGQTFPLAEAAKAHEALGARAALGKTLLVV